MTKQSPQAQDRNLFDLQVLPNNIELYTKIVETAYSGLEIILPVGSSHNTGHIHPGTFHFLEHMCCERSEVFPDPHTFKKFVGLKSARFNASTSPHHTSYYFTAPNQQVQSILPGFIASVFKPLFFQEDIDLQRTIIRNERQRKERWFPSDTELGQYLSTQWQWDQPLDLYQRLGSDQDLGQMSIEYLQQAHRHYLGQGIKVLYIGPESNPQLKTLLEALPTTDLTVPESTWQPMRWVNQHYHQRAFRDVSRHQLYFGAFQSHQTINLQERIQLQFIIDYLINPYHGPLHHWLREELGWLYEIGGGTNVTHTNLDWWLKLPLSSAEQVEQVRQQIWDKVNHALNQAQEIELEVERQLGTQAYSYQTTSAYINSAANELRTFQRIIPISEVVSHIESCRDLGQLHTIFRKYFDPSQMGEFYACPMDSQ